MIPPIDSLLPSPNEAEKWSREESKICQLHFHNFLFVFIFFPFLMLSLPLITCFFLKSLITRCKILQIQIR